MLIYQDRTRVKIDGKFMKTFSIMALIALNNETKIWYAFNEGG